MITFDTNLQTAVTVNEGDAVNLSVVVSSDDLNHSSFTYTWKKDGVTIVGATTNMITIASAVPATHNGVYTVIVDDLDSGSSILSTDQSVASTVTVTPAFVIGPIPGRTWEEHRRLTLLGYV